MSQEDCIAKHLPEQLALLGEEQDNRHYRPNYYYLEKRQHQEAKKNINEKVNVNPPSLKNNDNKSQKQSNGNQNKKYKNYINHFRTAQRFIHANIQNRPVFLKRSHLLVGGIFIILMIHLKSSLLIIPEASSIPNVFFYPTMNDDGSSNSHLKVEHQINPEKLHLKHTPWNSEPPTLIQFYDENNNNKTIKDKFIIQRHECLKHIRKRHDDVFKPILLTPMNTNNKNNNNHHPILLVDPAYHKNVGDQMLTVGEIQFIEQHLNLPAMDQCHYDQAKDFYRPCNHVINESPNDGQTKHALWNAGGNWGDLWTAIQRKRIPSFLTLLSNGYTVVSMPQSLYYSIFGHKRKDAMELKALVAAGLNLIESPPGQSYYYNNVDWTQVDTSTVFENSTNLQLARSRVILTWREKESYEEAQKLYPFARNVIVPDMAFQLGPYEPIRTHPELQVDIVMFLRYDKESNFAKQRNHKYIASVLRKISPRKKITFHIVDWNDRLDMFGNDESDYLFTSTAIELLSLGKVVVCDRLHAAILSYLIGIPFVYMDQVSGKITKALNVAFSEIPDCANGKKSKWERAMNLKEALVKAVAMIETTMATTMTTTKTRLGVRQGKYRKRNDNAIS